MSSLELLNEQVKKCFNPQLLADPSVQRFIDYVCKTYHGYEMHLHSLQQQAPLNHDHSLADNSASSSASRAEEVKQLQEILTELNPANKHCHSSSTSVLAAEIKKAVSIQLAHQQQSQEYTQSLEQINAELDQFAFVVSHDLKAPLRAVSNLAGWIAEDCGSDIPETSQEHLALLRKRVRYMENLISGILGYSRTQQFNEHGIADTEVLIHDVIESLTPPDTITVSVKGSFPVISTQVTKLQQVITNLISNAIRYTDRDGGQISIECIQLEDRCQFTVTDNGDGIPKEQHDSIFRLFHTLSPSGDDSSGIGLAIVRKLVEENKGRIWVESESGKGCRFSFTWPCTTILKTVKQ